MKKFYTLAKAALMLVLGGLAYTANAADLAPLKLNTEFDLGAAQTSGTTYEFKTTSAGTLTVQLAAANGSTSMLYTQINESNNTGTGAAVQATVTTGSEQYPDGRTATWELEADQTYYLYLYAFNSASWTKAYATYTGTLEGSGAATPVTINMVNPAPGYLPSDNYQWFINKFTIGLNNPDGGAIDTSGASVTINYYVDDNPTSASNVYNSLTTFSTSEIYLNTNDTNMESFLNQAKTAGASEWKVIISGVTVGGEYIEGSSVDNCSAEMGMITLTYTFSDGEAGGGDTDLGSAGTLTWGSPVTLGAGTYSEVSLPTDYVGEITVATNSSTDLTYNAGYTNDNAILKDGDGLGVYYETMEDGVNGKVYTYELEAGKEYKLVYKGTPQVEFTVTKEDSGSTTPTYGTITPETSFEIDDTTSVYEYIPSANVADFYFEVADFEMDVFEVSTLAYLVFSENPDGSSPIALQPVEKANGEYVYTGTDLVANTPYYLVQMGQYGYFKVTLYTEKYEAEVSNVGTATLNDPFTVSATATEYSYNNTTEADYYIVSDSNTDLHGILQVNYYGSNIFDNDVTAVQGEDGLVYNGFHFQSGETYQIVYTGSAEVTLTIKPGTYTPAGGTTYMPNLATPYEATITYGDPYSAVEITWGTEVSIVDAENIDIPVYFNDDIKGKLTATYVQLQSGEESEPGIDVLAETGDKGTYLCILTGTSGLFNEPGSYMLMIPAGIVANADGDVNQAQEVGVHVEALAEGTVSPEDGAIFIEGEDISFNISYEGEIVKNEDAEAVIYLFAGDGSMEVSYGWDADTIINVSEGGNAIVINLGEELPVGYYQLTLYEGVITVDGVENAMVEINFQVADENVGINGISSDLENAAIYTLQGVKVQNPAKGGIYIINGKKVLIK